jgi:hypothetical protein
MQIVRAPRQEPCSPPTSRDVFRARVKLHDIAGKLELQDAIFVRHVANKMLPLVPVVEDECTNG